MAGSPAHWWATQAQHLRQYGSNPDGGTEYGTATRNRTAGQQIISAGTARSDWPPAKRFQSDRARGSIPRLIAQYLTHRRPSHSVGVQRNAGRGHCRRTPERSDGGPTTAPRA